MLKSVQARRRYVRRDDEVRDFPFTRSQASNTMRFDIAKDFVDVTDSSVLFER